MNENLPPHSVEAEQSVLAAILFSPDYMSRVVDLIEPGDFYRMPHQLIYEACVMLFRLGEPIDINTITANMDDAETLADAGGRVYLMELCLSVATAENIVWYAKIVKNHSIKRQLQNMAAEIMGMAQSDDAIEVMEYAQSKILELARQNDTAKDPTASELVDQALVQIEQKLHHPNRVTGIQTGFPKLDEKIGGLRPSKLIILGARPGMGKSGLALNIATNIVVQQKRPVLFYSLEMEPVDMMERVLVSLAESNSHLGKLKECGRMVPDILRIIDRPNLTTTQLRASIFKNKLELKDIGLVVIDYLQLMKSSGGTRNEEVSTLTRELKNLTREFKIPILCLSQLSRNVESRQDKRPMKSDLRDSGSIEQDADTILFIYRDDYYNQDSDKPNVAEILIGKNRDGEHGSFDLAFRPSVIKFVDMNVRTNVF